MSKLLTLAKRQAFERLPETCPAVHTAGTEAIASFHSWLHRRQWVSHLSEKDVLKLEDRLANMVADLTAKIKERGTIPLREALIATIHENLLLSLSPARIARIEAGQDADAESLAAAPAVTSFRSGLLQHRTE